MKNYLFRTNATMKEYNSKKWWIDNEIIKQVIIKAINLDEALKKYQEFTEKSTCVTISNNALKNKEPLYIDTANGAIQKGFVITAKCDFQDDDNYKWTSQYIDLWVDIDIITSAFKD